MLYGEPMEAKKTLIWGTLAAALLILGGAVVFRENPKPLVVKESEGFLTMGKQGAPVEIVLIEDFQCRNCRVFSQKVLPKIRDEYVKTGKARFTLVPVSFLTGSHTIANAVLEVYRQKPAFFYEYLNEVLSHESEVQVSDLVRIARRMGGINLAKLQQCVEMGCHKEELEENLKWARKVMGAQFKTPSLYINGDPGSTYSFEAIQYQINHVFGKS